MDGLRLKKVSESYRQAVAEILLYEISDPDLEGVSITIVRLTPDLRLARIYFDALEGKVRELQVIDAFNRHKGAIKKNLATKVNLRFMPDLQFFYDETRELSENVEGIFRQLDEAKKKA